MARMEAVWLLLAPTAREGWQVHHMDVKTTFLNGELWEEVFVDQPPGFVCPRAESKVLKLHKALYGLHQAPRAWNQKLDEKWELWALLSVSLNMLSIDKEVEEIGSLLGSM
jgi:hypothetical protein